MVEHLVQPQPDDFDELDRREQVALDQGFHNAFLAHIDEPLHGPDPEDAPQASTYTSVRRARSHGGARIERGTPSGADVSRDLLHQEPFVMPTPAERLEHLEHAEAARMSYRRMVAAARYEQLLDTCRREDGSIDQSLLNARLRVQAEAEDKRRQARQALTQRIAQDIV